MLRIKYFEILIIYASREHGEIVIDDNRLDGLHNSLFSESRGVIYIRNQLLNRFAKKLSILLNILRIIKNV